MTFKATVRLDITPPKTFVAFSKTSAKARAYVVKDVDAWMRKQGIKEMEIEVEVSNT